MVKCKVMYKKNKFLCSFIRGLKVLVLLIICFFGLLLLNLKLNFLDQKKMTRSYLKLYGMQAEKKFGGIYDIMFFERSAKDEAARISQILNLKVIYDGLQRVPKNEGFVMIVNEYSILDACFLAHGVNLAREKTDAKVFRIRQYKGDNRSAYTMPLAEYGNMGNKLLQSAPERVNRFLVDGHPMIIVPSGKYDARFFDGPDRYFRFRSGFLRFARDAKVGILPVYIDLRFPLWLKLLNTFLPTFGETVIHTLKGQILQNQVVKINFGQFISYNDIIQDDLQTDIGFKQEVLDKYSEKVFSLKGSKLQHSFYGDLQPYIS